MKIDIFNRGVRRFFFLENPMKQDQEENLLTPEMFQKKYIICHD